MTALSFVWVYPYSQNSRCDIMYKNCLPHKAAQRISELKRFLYLRISGVSLSMTVGVTFTFICDPLLACKIV